MLDDDEEEEQEEAPWKISEETLLEVLAPLYIPIGQPGFATNAWCCVLAGLIKTRTCKEVSSYAACICRLGIANHSIEIDWRMDLAWLWNRRGIYLYPKSCFFWRL